MTDTSLGCHEMVKFKVVREVRKVNSCAMTLGCRKQEFSYSLQDTISVPSGSLGEGNYWGPGSLADLQTKLQALQSTRMHCKVQEVSNTLAWLNRRLLIKLKLRKEDGIGYRLPEEIYCLDT